MESNHELIGKKTRDDEKVTALQDVPRVFFQAVSFFTREQIYGAHINTDNLKRAAVVKCAALEMSLEQVAEGPLPSFQNPDICTFLLENEVDNDRIDTRGWTAAMVATKDGNVSVLGVLIANGCGLEVQVLATHPPLS